MSHQQITLQAHILQAIVLTSIGRNKQMLPQANFLQANVYKLMSTSKVDKQMWNKQISCHPIFKSGSFLEAHADNVRSLSIQSNVRQIPTKNY